ncbi:dihydrodipicolinate reductase [Pseudooceanicola sp. HF7]|uniref:dihydrodipicolinate reductase n=1 Tax=Pseudooceanicola sp. HF7 TaxID=2721560 RepID=UPI00143113C2|nr:dihydrodipicolinate reductase [Pseudooceanicola sp. HF7]NIZ09046.1 dihydrodipicolinate reductase [Pseudooceanicola sp. HF7]
MTLRALCLSACLLLALPLAAQDAARISSRSGFMALVQGRGLHRLGVQLTVHPDGQITGRAFGREVTGSWSWKEGYFCRVLYWGSREFPWNCQMVTRRGEELRFRSDRGTGEWADLRLR